MQAARGTSVERHRSRPRLIFGAVAVGLYAVDQVTKALAVAGLSDRVEPQRLVGSLVQLRLTRNPGAAFSTGTSYTGVITVVAVIAALAVLVSLRRLGSVGWAVALGLLLAGIVGNLTDRIFREPSPFHGHVVDFVELPHWPIFNVADMSINVAAVLIVILAFRGVRLNGQRIDADGSLIEPASDRKGVERQESQS